MRGADVVKSMPDEAGYYLDEYDGPRFWAHVDPNGGTAHLNDPLATASGGCWNWNGKPSDKNYGRFKLHGRWMQAHRVAFRDFGYKIADGLSMDHLCRNTACVRPAHLEPVTQADNVSRGIRGNVQECPQGHEYTIENTVIQTRNGKQHRYCRTCLKASKRRTYLKRKTASKS